MAKRENKSKSERINEGKEKESLKENQDFDLESGDNPVERERTSGSIKSKI